MQTIETITKSRSGQFFIDGVWFANKECYKYNQSVVVTWVDENKRKFSSVRKAYIIGYLWIDYHNRLPHLRIDNDYVHSGLEISYLCTDASYVPVNDHNISILRTYDDYEKNKRSIERLWSEYKILNELTINGNNINRISITDEDVETNLHDILLKLDYNNLRNRKYKYIYEPNCYFKSAVEFQEYLSAIIEYNNYSIEEHLIQRIGEKMQHSNYKDLGLDIVKEDKTYIKTLIEETDEFINEFEVEVAGMLVSGSDVEKYKHLIVGTKLYFSEDDILSKTEYVYKKLIHQTRKETIGEIVEIRGVKYLKSGNTIIKL